MIRFLLVVSVVVNMAALAAGQTASNSPRSQKPATHQPAGTAVVRYGHNPAAAGTFTHDGIALYYEIYGTGEPLLLVHGNGGSIATLRRRSSTSARATA